MSTDKFKPLLFTTTARNPERLKGLLGVLQEYEGQKLDNKIIRKVMGSLFKGGLITTLGVDKSIKNKWKNGLELSDSEVDSILNNYPETHKEAGFDRGLPSRFDTYYKIAKELGFVWYWSQERIVFSESARLLLDKNNPQNETLVFANAFAKYYRNNPFKRVSNSNKPLILLLETIRYLNKDKAFNGTGIAKNEIPILLCWRNNDARSLYKKIKELRKKHRYSASSETILGICYSLLDKIKRNDNSLLVDYPDEFIRKMRLTGLISIRGGGRFIDINTKEQKAVNFILENYNSLHMHKSEKDFFEYMGSIDQELVSSLTVLASPETTSTKQELDKWAEHYGWKTIAAELVNLSKKRSSKDEILKIIEQPLRLEFLTSLAIRKKLPSVVVQPNYISDDEGLPTSFAPGGSPDIACTEAGSHILVEVTLLKGVQQHLRESYSVQRHLEEYRKKDSKTFSVLMSPETYIDTLRHAEFIKNKYELEVRAIDIDKFIHGLEIHKTLNLATQ